MQHNACSFADDDDANDMASGRRTSIDTGGQHSQPPSVHSAGAGAGSRDGLPRMSQTETKPCLGLHRPSRTLLGAWCEEARRDDDCTQSDLELNQGRM